MNNRRWLSFHLFLDEFSVDRFLVEFLTPFVSTARADIRRFFFIRHSDDGIHLRLRFLVARSTTLEDFFSAVDSLITSYKHSSGDSNPADCRIEHVAYDRSLLYFGETRGSVYAELLNELTSRLALRLLSKRSHSKLRRFLTAFSAVLAIHQTVDSRPAAIDCAISRSLELLRLSLENNGVPALPNASLPASFVEYLDLHSKSMEMQFANDPTVQRVGRLLIRTRRLSSGEQICTHAVHLFCNKLGFSLPEEIRLMIALRQSLQRRKRNADD